MKLSHLSSLALLAIMPLCSYAASPTTTSDLGQGITLVQSETGSSVQIGDTVLKTFSHISKESPFVDSEGCDAFTKAINGSYPHKDQAWKSLGPQGQMSCIKENLKRTLSVDATTNKRFVTLTKVGYETSQEWIIDLQSKKILKFTTGEFSIGKIISGKSGTYIELIQGRGDYMGEIWLLNSSGKLIKQFDPQRYAIGNSTVKLDTFELVSSGKIRVKYTITQIRDYPKKDVVSHKTVTIPVKTK